MYRKIRWNNSKFDVHGYWNCSTVEKGIHETRQWKEKEMVINLYNKYIKNEHNLYSTNTLKIHVSTSCGKIIKKEPFQVGS